MAQLVNLDGTPIAESQGEAWAITLRRVADYYERIEAEEEARLEPHRESAREWIRRLFEQDRARRRNRA